MGVFGIKNVNIVTMNSNSQVVENGWLLIDDDTIIDIGGEGDLPPDTNIPFIDGENGILLPGMINGHTHGSMVAFRSLGDDVADRLKKYIFPLEERAVDKDLVYTSSKYAIGEMLLGGVTTYVDMYFFEERVARATDEMGIRAILGETVLNFKSPDAEKAYGGIDKALEFIGDYREHELIIPAIAPHAPYSLDEKHLKICSQISRDYKVPMIMHVAEMDFESERYRREYGKTVIEYLNDLGVLDDRLIAAHCINISKGDIDILGKKRVGIIHNPGANSKGAKGVAPIMDLHARNIPVGLGSDGAMSGNTLDIFTQMALTPKLHKLFNSDRSLLPAKKVVEMATIDGARAIKLDEKIGSIEVGKKADLIIVETKSLNMRPIYDYYSTLVYSANPSNVDTVIVNGEILVAGKKLKRIDEDILVASFEKVIEKVKDTV